MGKAAISMAIFHESEGNHYESEPRGELDGIAAMVLETVGGEGILVGPGEHQPR